MALLNFYMPFFFVAWFGFMFTIWNKSGGNLIIKLVWLLLLIWAVVNSYTILVAAHG